MKHFVTTLAAVIGTACMAAPALASLPADGGGPAVYATDWAAIARVATSAGTTKPTHKTIVVYDSLTVPSGGCQPSGGTIGAVPIASGYLVPAKYPRWNEKGACELFVVNVDASGGVVEAAARTPLPTKFPRWDY